MNFLYIHYCSVIQYDLITKFPYSNVFQITKLNSINLTIDLKNVNIKKKKDKKKIIKSLFLLKLISNQHVFVKKAKKNNVILKIKQNQIIGCQTYLYKKHIYFFLEKLFLFYLLNKKKYKGFLMKPTMTDQFHFQIQNIMDLFEYNQTSIQFQQLPSMKVKGLVSNHSYDLSVMNLLNLFRLPMKMEEEDPFI